MRRHYLLLALLLISCSPANSSKFLEWKNVRVDFRLPPEYSMTSSQNADYYDTTLTTPNGTTEFLSDIKMFTLDVLHDEYQECLSEYPAVPFPCRNREEKYQQYKLIFNKKKGQEKGNLDSIEFAQFHNVPLVIHNSICGGEPVCYVRTYTTFSSGVVIDFSITVPWGKNIQDVTASNQRADKLFSNLTVTVRNTGSALDDTTSTFHIPRINFVFRYSDTLWQTPKPIGDVIVQMSRKSSSRGEGTIDFRFPPPHFVPEYDSWYFDKAGDIAQTVSLEQFCSYEKWHDLRGGSAPA